MQTKLDKKYRYEGVQQYMMNGGGGQTAVHDILTNTSTYTRADTTEYVYAIECYTDGLTFTTLAEDGVNVPARRLGGTTGYPQGTIITGKFSRIVPAATHECGIFIKKSTA